MHSAVSREMMKRFAPVVRGACAVSRGARAAASTRARSRSELVQQRDRGQVWRRTLATGTVSREEDATPLFRPPHIVTLAGSVRSGSLNQRLAAAASKIAEDKGCRVTHVPAGDLRGLPVYDGDLESESGPPEAVTALKDLLASADGMLVASPEYNGSVTPLLKNVLDWCSRSHNKDEPPYRAFKHKAAAIVSASPGALGGIRGMVHCRDILGYLGCIVVPEQAAIGAAYKAFDESGALKEPQHASVQRVVEQLMLVARDVANRDAACAAAHEQAKMCGEYGHIDIL